MHTAILALAQMTSLAQVADPSADSHQADPAAAIAAAERAAGAAERAANEAEKAWRSAREAASSARAAAEEAKRAMGMPVAAQTQTQTQTQAQVAPPPADENLPVRRPVGTERSASVPPVSEGRTLSAALSGSVANGVNDAPLKTSPVPDLQVLVSSTDKVASIAWTVDVSGQPQSETLAADQFTLTATGKLDDDGNASVFGLSGFPNGTGVKVAYTHYATGVRLTGVEKDPVRVARERCLAGAGTDLVQCDPYAYDSGVSSFVAKYNPQGLKPLLSEVLPGPVWFWGVSFSGDQAAYSYLDRATFSLMKSSRFGYGAGLFGGVLLGHGQTALTGSFDYRRRYEENDAVTLCQPVAGSSLTQCLTGADGLTPVRRRAILGLELRHAFAADVGEFATLAVAPRFSLNVEDDSWSIDVPLYFAGDDAGKLRGGVRGVYLNQRAKVSGRADDVTVGLFVGLPFSVFRQ